MGDIYLDYAAATPLDEAVAKVMQPYWSEQFYNPSAGYLTAKAVRGSIEEARTGTASILGAKPVEVIFTAGGTESNNLVIRGILENFPDKHVIVSAIEHESVLRTTEKFNHSILPVKKDGLVEMGLLERLVQDETVLISIMYANNEIGVTQKLSEVGQLIKRIRQDRQARNINLPIFFHTDASQAGNHQDLHVDRLMVDLMTLSGSKIYGPKQSSCLYVRTTTEISEIISGGGQELGLRSGTENVPAIMGFAEALKIAQGTRKEESKRLGLLKKIFISGIQQIYPNVVINGNQKHCLPNIISLTFPGVDGESLMMILDQMGVMVSTGSACSASDDSASHVLLALGVNSKIARSTLRVSMGRPTTEQNVNDSIKIFQQALSKLQNIKN